MRISFYTLGCKVNQNETGALQQLFLAAVDDVNDGKRVVHLMIPSFFKIAFTLYHQAGDV